MSERQRMKDRNSNIWRIASGFFRLTPHALRLAPSLFSPHASRLAAAALLCMALAACGFQLRGQATLPFDSLYVQGSPVVANQVARSVRAGSHTRVIDNPKDAQVTLQILSELRDRVILSLSAAGRVRELTLRYTVAYRLTDAKGIEYIPATQIVLRREITYSDSDVLGKEQEEALLYRDMQNDAIQQIVRRLQVAKLDLSSPPAKNAP
jgi:LPS-assembly lipoprotein